MPVNNYTFFHSLSQIYYRQNNPELVDTLNPSYQKRIQALKKITDQVFESYNLFAFIIHDPEKHKEFAENLKRQFLNFHHKTGKQLLFFALTQPPEQWKDEEVQPEYFKHLQQVFREDRKLAVYPKQIEANLFNNSFNVRAISKVLKIPYEQLPAIVITSHPSLSSFQWYRTCTKQLGKQLKELAIVANELQQYKIECANPEVVQMKMFDLIKEEYDNDLNICEGKGDELLTESLATALSELLSFLINSGKNNLVFNEMAKSQINIAMRRVTDAIKETKGKLLNDNNNTKYLDILDDLCEKVGTFITLLQSSKEQNSDYSIQDFEVDSNQLFKIGNSVGNFLRSYQNHYPDLDFTPSAICLAKAFEIEINKSIVHWIRKKNNIILPDFYNEVQPGIDALVTPNMNNGKPINFNKSRENGTWHPPAMGQSYLIASKNIEKHEWKPLWIPEERKLLLREWQKISEIRNNAAHSEKVSVEDMMQLIESIKLLDTNLIFSKMASMRESFSRAELAPF